MKRALLPLIALIASACIPLTLSHESKIDFVLLQSVYVQPVIAEGADVFDGPVSRYQRYVAQELREHAGFRTVTTNELDRTDCVLVIKVTVDATIDLSEDEDEYDVDGDYTLRTPNGEVIAEGSVRDSANEANSAVELALDEVVHAFLRPYRL